MNVLSLFDGLSGGQIALRRAGIEYDNYFASEIDKYAIQVTQNNYPDTIQLGNIEEIKGVDLPKIDLVIGGSPCQGFSFAGKQLNFKDPRSALFFEYVRLLKETEPKHFLLENTKMKKKYEQIISKYLGVNSIEINSALVSAQNRKRLYWTNILGITQPEDRKIMLNGIIDGNYYSTRNKSYCIDANYNKGTNFRRYFFCGSRQLLLENGYNPTPRITKKNANEIMLREGNKWRKLTPIECERTQTVPDTFTEGVSNTQRYKMLGNAFTVDVIVHILKYLK